MTLDELLNAANQLNETDLETLLNRLWLLHARRKASILPVQEASLLLQINQGLPTDLHQRYHILAEKRDSETLATQEYEELLQLSDRIEHLTAQRLEALINLATLRQVPLLQLMDDLGIQSPSYA
jgi:DNA-binding transcriptional regulator YbjK